MKFSVKKSLVALSLSVSVASMAAPVYASPHKVQEGDTLYKIAWANGVSLESVKNANPGNSIRNLQIGQTVHIPESDTYTVKNNETFWTIARKLNVPLGKLLLANPRVNPLNLYKGIELNLPLHTEVEAAYVSSKPQQDPAADNNPKVKTASGQALSYKKVISAVATAYSAAPEENGKWGAIDFMGNPLKLGTIAVDPNVIPMGTKLYITGYNNKGLPVNGMFATASDQGGAIKGNRVDIFLPGSRDEVKKFGIQNVKIYVLE